MIFHFFNTIITIIYVKIICFQISIKIKYFWQSIFFQFISHEDVNFLIFSFIPCILSMVLLLTWILILKYVQLSLFWKYNVLKLCLYNRQDNEFFEIYKDINHILFFLFINLRRKFRDPSLWWHFLHNLHISHFCSNILLINQLQEFTFWDENLYFLVISYIKYFGF